MLTRYSHLLVFCCLLTVTYGSGGGPAFGLDGCDGHDDDRFSTSAQYCGEGLVYADLGAGAGCYPSAPCLVDVDLRVVEPWECDPCTLSGVLAALNGCQELAGVDLSGPIAMGGYFVGVNLSATDLTGANLSDGDFQDAYLRDANLTAAVLQRTQLDGANLRRAVLTDADLTDARLTDAHLVDAVWSNTTCPDASNSDDHGGTCCGHLAGAVSRAGCD